jgi:hypothetical protein
MNTITTCPVHGIKKVQDENRMQMSSFFMTPKNDKKSKPLLLSHFLTKSTFYTHTLSLDSIYRFQLLQ